MKIDYTNSYTLDIDPNLKYTFSVSVMNVNGEWSEAVQKQFKFSIYGFLKKFF